MLGQAKEVLGNTTTVRKTPSRYGVDTGQRIAAFATVDYMELVPVQSGGVADGAGDKWLKLGDNRYINQLLSGRVYYSILREPTPDPEPEPDPTPLVVKVDFTVTDPVTGKKYGATGIELPEIT